MKIIIALTFLAMVYAIPRPEFRPLEISTSSEGLEQPEPISASDESNQAFITDAAALNALLSKIFNPEESKDYEDDDSDKKISLEDFFNSLNIIKDLLKRKNDNKDEDSENDSTGSGEPNSTVSEQPNLENSTAPPQHSNSSTELADVEVTTNASSNNVSPPGDISSTVSSESDEEDNDELSEE